MGFWNFADPDPDVFIDTHDDGGGTIDGIDILFDANQDETEAQNKAAFREDVRRLGFDISAFGGSLTFDGVADTLTLSVRKTSGLYSFDAGIKLAQVVKYFFDQTKMDIVLAGEELAEAIGQAPVGQRLVPHATPATYITRNMMTDDPILSFEPISTIVGTNILDYHRQLFEGWVRNTLGFVPSSSAYAYTFGTHFTVEIKVGSSPVLNEQFSRIASTLHNTQGVMVDWYSALVGDKTTPLGLRKLAQ